MPNLRRTNILSGLVAGMGVFSVAALEIAFTPYSGNALQFAAISLTVAVAGLLRWYMFYEGTALGQYNQKDARTALRMSIVLALALFIYGVALFGMGVLEAHLFGLFTITNLGLVFAEWVFGRRTSYHKPKAVEILEGRTERLLRIAKTYKRRVENISAELSAVRNRIDELQGQVTAMDRDLNANKARVGELTGIIAEHDSELDRLRAYEQAAADAFFIDPSGAKFKICTCGKRVELTSNNTKVLACDCGKVVYQKNAVR